MKNLTIKESIKEIKILSRHAIEAGLKGHAYVGYKNDSLNNYRKYIDRIKESKSKANKNIIHNLLNVLDEAENETYRLHLIEIENRKQYNTAIKVMQESINYLINKNEGLKELIENKKEFEKNMNNEGIKWLDEQLKYLEETRNKMVAYNQATKKTD